VIAIEPEPTLRAAATAAAADAPVPVRVLAGVADSLPLEDGSVDTEVASLVLCSVPDQDRALAELHRVLRPGGELRFHEHVIANCQPRRVLLQALDHSGLWPRISGGCHPARDTGGAIERAGFRIQMSEEVTAGQGNRRGVGAVAAADLSRSAWAPRRLAGSCRSRPRGA
jgi:ubiquinone/menaquinone biosynthesis C-methylase UbiE